MKFDPLPYANYNHLGVFRISNKILDGLVYFIDEPYTKTMLSEVFGKVIILSATREKDFTVYLGRSELFEESDIETVITKEMLIPIYKLTFLVENKTKSEINMETGVTSSQKYTKTLEEYSVKFEKV
jgi:uncharacterized protein VirK/YbjX